MGSAESPGASSLPTLVFVRRRQCGTSRKMESLVAWIKVTQKRFLRVLTIDADRHPAVLGQLGVDVVPSLLLMQDGRVVGRLEGRATGRQIEALIRSHVAHEPAPSSRVDEREHVARSARRAPAAGGARPRTVGT